MPLLNLSISGANSESISIDARWSGNALPQSVVLFCHGYKGFKDWGGWNAMADELCSDQRAVVKFNFSHSGVGQEDLVSFSRLDLFEKNNYTFEVEDVGHVLKWIQNESSFRNVDKIHLMGHSRGGGIAILAEQKYQSFSSLITMASVCDFENRFPMDQKLEDWKKNGVFFAVNGRTGQKMPHGIQFYHDFIENQEKLDIKRSMKSVDVPTLIIHAGDDKAVHISAAKKLKKWNPKAEMLMMASGGHTFDLKHPWEQSELPQALLKVLEEIKAFLS